LGFLEIILSTSQIINGTIFSGNDIIYKSTNHPENVGPLTPVNISTAGWM
jgi:hypothetical protein